MDILDQYCAEVAKYLPRRQRADIQAEIRATLEDMLNDRSRASGQPIDNELITAVLKDYGAPAKVAAAYRPERSLIGPRLYPTFELVLKIVLTAVLGGVAVASLATSFVDHSGAPALVAALGRFFPALMPAVTSAFGAVALVFALVERLVPAKTLDLPEAEWDPARLASRANPDRVKPVDLILGIVFTAIGLFILDVYPNAIGFGYFAGSQWVFVGVMSQAFFIYRPWMNLLGLAQIGFGLFMLRRPTWQPSTRLANLIIRAAGLPLIVAMLNGPQLVAIPPGAVAGTVPASAAPLLVTLLGLGFTIGLLVAAVVTCIEIGFGVYRLWARPTLRPWPAAK